MCKLFDEIIRSDTAYKGYAESEFCFLNRTAIPIFTQIRDQIEAWFDKYPDSAKKDLRERFRSRDYMHHVGALTELMVYHMLRGLGGEVVVNPVDGGTLPGIPDFKVTFDTRQVCYVEVAATDGKSEKERSDASRKNILYDIISKIKCPNYFIGIDIEGETRNQPNSREIRAFLEDKLAKLNYKELISKSVNTSYVDLMPHWPYCFDGGKIVFYPIPKKPEFCGNSVNSPIGLMMDGTRRVRSNENAREILHYKASKYKNINAPFLIVVNQIDAFADLRSEQQALFGDEEVTFSVPDLTQHSRRKSNGVWRDSTGARRRHVGAVIFIERLVAYSVASAPVRVYLNPWSSRAIPNTLCSLTRFFAENNSLQKKDGKTLREILKVPADWPSNDAGAESESV